MTESENLESVKAQTDDDSIGFYRKCGFTEEKNAKPQKPAEQAKSYKSVDNKPKKKTFKERQEFAAVEQSIAALEAEKADIETALCTGALTADELTEKSIRLSALNEELDEKTLRWLELSEIPD